jgi:hypothetical protein
VRVTGGASAFRRQVFDLAFGPGLGSGTANRWCGLSLPAPGISGLACECTRTLAPRVTGVRRGKETAYSLAGRHAARIAQDALAHGSLAGTPGGAP